jgi:hypothetical protein
MITVYSFLLAFIIIYISGSVAGILLDILNSSHLKKIGQKAPACFEGFLDDSLTCKDDILYGGQYKGLSNPVYFRHDIFTGNYFIRVLPWLSNN